MNASFRSLPCALAAAITTLGSISLTRAQSRPAEESEVVQLNEFQVTSNRDTTYRATNAAAGTRLGTAIKDLPQSVTVLTQDFLEDIGAIRLEDALAYVGGVTTGESQPNGGDGTTIRGYLAPFPFKDGVRDESLNTKGDMADVERVEVLRGPSSFIYGNVFGFGGVINKISKRPKATPGFNIRAVVADYDFYRGELDLTGPISADKTLRYRLVYALEDGDTYRDYTHGRRMFISPKLTKVFSAATQLNFDGEFLRTSITNDPNVPITTGSIRPINVPPSHFLGEPWAKNEVRKRAARMMLDHRFNASWSFRQTVAAVISNADKHNIALTGTLDPVRPVTTKQDGIQIIHSRFYLIQGDVIGRFTTGPATHRFLTGYEIDRDHVRNDGFTTPLVGAFNVYRPVYNFPKGTTTQNLGNRSSSITYAGYISDQVSFLKERLQFVGGLRADKVFGKSSSTVNTAKADVSLPVHWTPRVGIVVRPVEALSFYAVYAEGFIPDRSARVTWPDNEPVQPEEGEMKEAGVKADFLEGKLSLNASAFTVARTNVIRAAPSPSPAGSIVQLGAEQADGAEFSFTAELFTGFTAIGSYNYIDGYVVRGERNIPDGKPLQNTPTHAGQVWLKYNFARGPLAGLGVRFDIRRTGHIYGRVNQNVNLPGYTLMNGGLSYRFSKALRLQLNVSNLADKYYFRAAGASAAIALGAPRSWMSSASYAF